MYHIDDDGKYVMVLLYVDDILCATKNETFKKQMFENQDEDYIMKGHGLLSNFWDVQVEQSNDSIKIHQAKYCDEIIDRFKIGDD